MVDKELLGAISAMMDEKLKPIQDDMTDMKGDVAALKADVAKYNHEDRPKLNILMENTRDMSRNSVRLNKIEETVEEHGDRITLIERAMIASNN